MKVKIPEISCNNTHAARILGSLQLKTMNQINKLEATRTHAIYEFLKGSLVITGTKLKAYFKGAV